MSLPVIVSGDDVSLQCTLLKDDATFAIDTASSPIATVNAAIVSLDHTRIIVQAVSQDSSAVGADWTASLVVVAFTGAQTSAIDRNGEALLEIEVNDAGRTTFFSRVRLITGLIA